MFDLIVSSNDAQKLRQWIKEDGGVAVWNSVNLGNPGGQWLTGAKSGRPNWQAGVLPAQVITDPTRIGVLDYKLVKRFHVAVRPGSNGLSLKLTDASSARVRKALAAAGPGATYDFDYWSQDALIFAPAGDPKPLVEVSDAA